MFMYVRFTCKVAEKGIDMKYNTDGVENPKSYRYRNNKGTRRRKMGYE
jgi:hypothetical protein